MLRRVFVYQVARFGDSCVVSCRSEVVNAVHCELDFPCLGMRMVRIGQNGQ